MTAWTHDPAYDPLKFAAFVYKITTPDGYYIGKRAIWVCKAGAIVRESDWRSYWGSGEAVKAAVKKHGKAACTREIIAFAESRGKAGWLEMVLLVKTDALLDPRCLNGNIVERYQKRVVQGWADHTRCQRYLADVERQRRAAGLLEG